MLIPERAIISMAGVETIPALTAVSPRTRAPTTARAIPTYFGIRTLVSFRSSKMSRTKNISRLGEKGISFIPFTIVRRKFSGMICRWKSCAATNTDGRRMEKIIATTLNALTRFARYSEI